MIPSGHACGADPESAHGNGSGWHVGEYGNAFRKIPRFLRGGHVGDAPPDDDGNGRVHSWYGCAHGHAFL